LDGRRFELLLMLDFLMKESGCLFSLGTIFADGLGLVPRLPVFDF
jgi:hypothetical protein